MQSREIVDAIVHAAEALTVAGLDRVRSPEIAAHAGVDLATLQAHFPNEKAVFAEVFRRRHLQYFDAVDEVLVAHETLEGGIEQLVRILLDLSDREVEARRGLNTQIPVSWSVNELRDALHIIRRRIVQWAMSMVPGVPEKEMGQRVYVCLGILRGLAMMRFLDLDDAPPTESVVVETRRILVDVVRGAPAR